MVDQDIPQLFGNLPQVMKKAGVPIFLTGWLPRLWLPRF
jgi:hypothetical protein